MSELSQMPLIIITNNGFFHFLNNDFQRRLRNGQPTSTIQFNSIQLKTFVVSNNTHSTPYFSSSSIAT
ncbi:hypothetical protein QVD17_17810 [Tagetes erecta]|uniref:Uncharacterized protein n=1 Tax=Tagetes erecta TaxID=13708 RepID=A0AAD8KSZ0_TARER|nr:hypothetical protein QVD17_17810 [Tagetes erecta]